MSLFSNSEVFFWKERYINYFKQWFYSNLRSWKIFRWSSNNWEVPSIFKGQYAFILLLMELLGSGIILLFVSTTKIWSFLTTNANLLIAMKSYRGLRCLECWFMQVRPTQILVWIILRNDRFQSVLPWMAVLIRRVLHQIFLWKMEKVFYAKIVELGFFWFYTITITQIDFLNFRPWDANDFDFVFLLGQEHHDPEKKGAVRSHAGASTASSDTPGELSDKWLFNSHYTLNCSS